jgi:urea transporter
MLGLVGNVHVHEHLRRWRTPALTLAIVLALAQIALAAHSLQHFVAAPDEQHHCPACKLADHSPALTAELPRLSIAVASAEEPPPVVVFLATSPSIVFLPRGPPASSA